MSNGNAGFNDLRGRVVCTSGFMVSPTREVQGLNPGGGRCLCDEHEHFKEDKDVRIASEMRPIRGMSAVVMGAGPAHACFFATYEHSKQTLSQLTRHRHEHLTHGLSGCLASLVHDAVSNPAEGECPIHYLTFDIATDNVSLVITIENIIKL
ncbi:unnamed protein product [Chilo suppressalis]|uniref:Uncharacterized protein n=1 Tax=Chilo suppressalis TaxID=168631 RepID=A0ABN8AYN0_CHISP|nr:unnamed protein product [Chilo suppressalis]